MTNAMAANNIRAQKIQNRAKDIDTRIADIIKLDSEIKEMQEKLKAMKIEFAGEYFVEENGVAETITGVDYEMDKIPHLTKKEYDTKALAVLVEAAGENVKDVIARKMVVSVNEKALEKLVKSGKISKAMVDKTISGNMNYRMVPKHLG